MSRTNVRRLAASSLAVALLSACSGPAAAPATVEPAVAATVAPTAARTAASAVPSPSPTTRPAAATAEPATAGTVLVGNTDGEGVFIRKTPSMADRLKAYPDNTVLTVIGDDVDGDGQHWKHVRTPDGVEGYVPSMYTVDAPQ